MISDAVIIELAPLDASSNAENKNINTLKSNPLPLISGRSNPLTAVGNVSFIKFVIESSEIENIDATSAIKARSGIIVSTKEKANCPGKMDITGFFIIISTSLYSFFNLSIIVSFCSLLPF